MGDALTYYLAFNNGLKVLHARGTSTAEVGEFFQGKTLEHLAGCREKPEVVVAAVAFDGGYRTEDAGLHRLNGAGGGILQSRPHFHRRCVPSFCIPKLENSTGTGYAFSRNQFCGRRYCHDAGFGRGAKAVNS